jgi:energy-coupling factor transporter ATP-binding protein EcfA2
MTSTATATALRIISFRAENVKRLKAVEITPDGNVVVLAGRNGQGKSSVLDAIWMALGGGPAAKDTTRPIRDGEAKAQVRLDLGDLIVTRTWTASGTTLKVESKDGASYKSPQSMLDGLVGRMSFDPLAFAAQPAKAQVETLLGFIDLPFDLGALDAERARVFAERTDINRDLKRVEAQLAGMPQTDLSTPTVEVSAAEIAAEMQAAQVETRRIDAMEADAARHERDAARHSTEVDRLTAEIRRLTAARDAEIDATENSARLAALARADLAGVQRPDLSGFQHRLSEVDIVNRAVRAARQRTEQERLVAETKAASTALTARLTEIDETKAKAIADADMPIPGLGFDETGVTFGGVPFRQCSSAEQLRVSVAMAMALNPTVRVIRITDGSLLDSESMRLIEEMARDRDYQVWIERVDETGEVGVVIEDGEVKP